MKTCRHCGKDYRCLRPKRLCWVCSSAPEIRALYPSTSKFARRGLGHGGLFPVEKTYPDKEQRVRCGCGCAWDGECALCEREQRRLLPLVEDREIED